MILPLKAEKVPIRIKADGSAYVGNTRVRLETVISAFHRGDSPEQIVDSFDVLSLAEVYGVIAYYLNHLEIVDAYIQQQNHLAEQIHHKIAKEHPQMFSLRARLTQRKQQLP
jgi:uncharacterized protein (DUF433 family)